MAQDILAGRHRRTPDLAAERDFPVEKTLYEAGYRSRLGLPLRIGRGVLGALNLAWRHPAGYSTAHFPLLDQVADAIALAIERRRLFEETRSRALQQEALNAVIAAAIAAPDMLHLAETALEHTLQAMNIEIGAIWVAGQRAYHGLNAQTGQRIAQATQTAQLGFSGPIIVEDWAGQAVPQSVRALTQLVAELGLRSSLSIPILTGGKRIGAIFLAAASPRAWTSEEIALAEAIGRQLGNAAERLHLLERTRKQARRVQQIMDTVPEGVIFLDAQRRIALANPAAEEYLALLAGAKEHDLLTHLGDKSLDTLLKPEPVDRPYHEIRVNQPAAHVFELVSRPLADETEAGGWVILLHDVTESRRVQEQAQEQERLAAVGQLAAGIAHDFNNLLTGIIGFAELLQMRMDISEPGRSYLNQITKLGRQAANLIGQILDFSRKSVSQQQTLDLVPFLKESIKFLERTIPESIRIVLEVTPGEFVIKGDPTKIQQVLTNLAVNARDAMPAGGELRFRLACFSLEPDEPPPSPDLPAGDWIMLAVSDTGSGIPQDIQAHIFEPFFTTKERGKGTGLGLAQVYGIVKQHQGAIDVSSQAGEGTTFTIFMPAVIEPKAEPVENLEQQMPRGHGETILLVEDEPDVLEVNQIILAELGYRTISSGNGRQALELYGQHGAEIDLVLTDMVMPEMDGLALFEALKIKNPEVSMIIMTGYPLQADARKALSQGRVRWLQKPVTIPQLAQAVSQALEDAPQR
jgi:signal transduction histidine kinase/ActR/RegA family two-component response regulator